jgi:hypothetical protein
VWHDPDTALIIAKSKGLLDDCVAEDGTVDSAALRKALDKLAKDNAHLVKLPTDGSGPSGEPGSQRANNGQETPEAKKARLADRFGSALRV